MGPALATLAILALTAGAAHPAADTLALRCSVRETAKPGAQGRDFQPPVAGADLGRGLVATASLSRVHGGQRVDVAVADATGAEREIEVDFALALPGEWASVFVPDGNGPRPLTESGSATYRGNCGLPLVTLYGARAGVTVAAALEVPAPALSFSWSRTGDGAAVTAHFANLRLPAKGEARASLLVGRHEGCWRPGLGWLVQLYPEYFDPPNPKVWDYDGPMIYDFVTTEPRLRRDLAQGLAWQELGWYWPHLGLYLPPGESWVRQPGSEGGLGEGGTVTRTLLNDYIALASRMGVAQCLYFQSTESWADYAEKQFPECRIRDAEGRLAPTWVKCVVMDPSPEGRFGQHIRDQARDLVEAFPGMAGVFWDQNAYTAFDFAHDDGISMVNGRRASMMEFPQKRELELVGKMFHDHGKVIFTNGGWTAGLARFCDGHMSEGLGGTRMLQYICMRKHLTLLAYDSDLAQAREKLLLALETGAQPSVTLGDDACRALCEGYVPLFQQLRRKSWVFHPRALTLPPGVVGNIFRNGEGNYVVTAVASETPPVSPAEQLRPATVQVRLPDLGEVACVFALDPQRRGLQAVDGHREADGWAISLPRPQAGAALLLARRGRWVGSGTPQLLAGREQPVSLVVANLTPDAWSGQWRFQVADREITRDLRLGAFQVQQVPLGPVPVGEGQALVSVHVTCPPPGPSAGDTTLDIPVVAPLALALPSGDVVQARRSEMLDYALVSRLPQSVTASVRARWDGAAKPAAPTRISLKPGEVRALAIKVQTSRPGQSVLTLDVGWPGGHLSRSLRMDVVDAVLPRDFTPADVTGLALHMDIFNSLGDQWADKPVKVNGVLSGPLPITGCTLRWHEGLSLQVPEQAAREMVRAGLQPGGDVELAVSVDDHVNNCFKVRNLQATVLTRPGAKYVSTCSREVYCSDAGWLYAEGHCGRLGEQVPAGTVRLVREK